MEGEFDALQYIASHDDLILAFGANATAGEQHYVQLGQAEGRVADDFNEAQYLANYPDLQAAFGADAQAATVHFITNGFAEGRTDAAAAPPELPSEGPPPLAPGCRRASRFRQRPRCPLRHQRASSLS
jgi:hypothetical protein